MTAQRCPWQFHGISCHDNGDGTVTLAMEGWRYTSSAERDPGDISECIWCHSPVRRDQVTRTWLADGTGEACPDSGPGYWHRPQSRPQTAAAPGPCMTRTVPARSENWGEHGERIQVYDTAAAAAMVAGHIGDPYVPVWHGNGWAVEVRSGHPLWQVTC